jgi:hypothetical protein
MCEHPIRVPDSPRSKDSLPGRLLKKPRHRPLPHGRVSVTIRLRGEVVVFRFPDRKQSQERQDRRCGEVVADVPGSPGSCAAAHGPRADAGRAGGYRLT